MNLSRYGDSNLIRDKALEQNSYFSKAYNCKGDIFLYDLGISLKYKYQY